MHKTGEKISLQKGLERTIRLRTMVVEDTNAVTTMLDAYMLETFGVGWSGTADAFSNAVFQHHRLRVLVAEADEDGLAGFAAWQWQYDLHHCVVGGEILDLYVPPRWRRKGVATLLLTRLAKDVQVDGGVFLKGQSVEDPGVQSMYARVAHCFPGANCYVSGRAFRALAELSGKSVKTIAQHLPDAAWNKEP